MQKKTNTFGKSLAYSFILLLLFSLSILFVDAQFKDGTCKNPNGGDYCGKKSLASNCYCDTACTGAKDCCADHKEVCSGASSGSGGGISVNVSIPKPCVMCAAPPAGCKYLGSDCYGCGKLVCEPVCGNGICEEGEADNCPPCVYDKVNPCKIGSMIACKVGTCPKDCKTKIQCYSDKDCTSISKKYCEGSAACTSTINYVCNNPGTSSSSCVQSTGTGKCEICQNGCNNGECIAKNQITKQDVIDYINNNCFDKAYEGYSAIVPKSAYPT